MAQAVQRIIDARRGEQRERQILPMLYDTCAVAYAVIHDGKIGQIENLAHQRDAARVETAFDMHAVAEREVNGDRRGADADFQRHPVIFEQQIELPDVIFVEQIGPRKRCAVPPRPRHETERKPRVDLRRAFRRDRHIGITGA